MMIIAIDGPSGSGKGTLSKRLAEHYNLAFLETGLLYRAVAEKMLQYKVSPEDTGKIIEFAEKLDVAVFEKEKLRSDEVAILASKIAIIPGVRKALLQVQRDLAHNTPEGKYGVVMDGRDIGTTVCPDANVKFFLTSAVEIRATRRHKELQNLGINSIYNEVLRDMIARDKRDSERVDSPLMPALDAHILDTSEKSIEEVLASAIQIIEAQKVKGMSSQTGENL